jgi:uncharacterized membrane protein
MTGTFNALIAATLFFVGGHFLLSSLFLRQPLVRRLGERNFRIFYSVLMLVAFAWMVKAYGQAPYLVIWHPPEVLRWVPVAILPFACLFLVAGLSTPGVTAVGGEKLLEEDPRAAARGIYSITRHPTLWAFGLWALSHLAVRGDFSSICMMGGIAFLSFFGMVHIDLRREVDLGAAWGPVRLTTSKLPFAAILTKRCRFDLKGIGAWRIVGGVILYVALLYGHAMVIGVDALPR